jgi:alanine-glyoxylate transaminase/serine-glyoxylate transaminase/serine-pyruvate transaminase
MHSVKQVTPIDTILPPSDLPLDNILPCEPLLLMGAGPVPVPDKVAAANSVVINHLGSTMGIIIERVKIMAQYVFQTKSPHILGVAGPASAAMEMAITNLVWPGRKVLCIDNGLFSRRFAEMALRVGGECTIVQVPTGESTCIDKVKPYLEREKFDVLTIAHGETSSTVLNSALQEICRLAKSKGLLTIVDGVCTLSTMPLPMDAWDVDIVVTGGQKGLSSIPGVSILALSEDAWDAIRKRQAPMPHWCLDCRLAQEFWRNKGYHYTAPVSGILALHEALRLICLETLPRRFQRHETCSLALQRSLEVMGLSLYVKKINRLNSVVGFHVPLNTDSTSILQRMSNEYGVEISGAFGLNILRIGQMGEQCRVHHILRTLHALGASLISEGVQVDVAAAMFEFEGSFT